MHVDELCELLRAGGLCIVQDDPGREDEGDFVALGAHISAESLNIMVTEGRGLVCVPVGPERARELDLAPMAALNGDPHGTAFTVSVDAIGTGTGISVEDRLRTIRTLASDNPQASDLRRPGHIFPLVGRAGGLDERRGHTEASLELARLAGSTDCAVICEILASDGSMLRGQGLRDCAARLGVPILGLDEILAWKHLEQEAAELPTTHGHFRILPFHAPPESAVLVTGDPQEGIPLVRIHSECLTGDVFRSRRCDCGPQLDAALEAMEAEGRGLVFYLRQEGRGIGLHRKLAAYRLQDKGRDTLEANIELGLPADARHYGAVGAWLLARGIRHVRLLSNNPAKVKALADQGIQVDRVPLWTTDDESHRSYRTCKIERFGHLAPGLP